MAQIGIETHQLGKTYESGDGEPIPALQGIDLSVAQGEIYALLGPNGAGKTTTISILTTLLPPTTGSAKVAGYDTVRQAEQVRRRIGVTFQEIILDQDLTGKQLLDFHGRLYGQPKAERQRRIAELSDMVELTAAIDRQVSRYSGGMKRRLELARGLMTCPEVLFLDEPTQGLDPQNRAGIWSYIRELREETGLTLLLTTHYMEEAETLADRVGIIDKGKLIVEGRPADLVRQMGADVVTMCGHGLLKDFQNLIHRESYVSHLVEHENVDGEWCLQIGVDHGDRRLVSLIALAMAADVTLTDVSVSRPDLADVFLANTGHALRDV
jgi:ABC-2 type transport system ATP-binding protein